MEVLTAVMGSQKPVKGGRGSRALVRDPKTGYWQFGPKDDSQVAATKGKPKPVTQEITKKIERPLSAPPKVRERPNFRVDSKPADIPEFRLHFASKAIGGDEEESGEGGGLSSSVVSTIDSSSNTTALSEAEERPRKVEAIEESYEEKGEYEVLQSDVFQKVDVRSNSNLVYVLELHCLAIPLSSPSMSPTFRVFVQQGKMTLSELKTTCYNVSSAWDAQELYLKLYQERLAQKYMKVRLLSTKVGSAVAKKEGLSHTAGENYGNLNNHIRGFVEQLFSEARVWLSKMLIATITDVGIETQTGVLTETQIDLGESLLCELLRLFKNGRAGGGKPYLETDLKTVTRLTNEFYSAIPHAVVQPFESVVDFELKQDLLSVMRTLVSVSETKGAMVSSVTSPQAKQYQALGCDIQYLMPASPEYCRVQDLVNKSQVGPNTIQILKVYACARPLDKSVFRNDIESKMLFHGTRSSNLVGILSNGLVLPQIAVSKYGGGRWDVGNLGAGIYFSDSASTSITYSLPSPKTNTRFLLVCNVALGKIKEYTTFQQGLEQAPEGFDSVRGVSSRHDDFSEFDDDEYVVYNANQHTIKYIVEYNIKGDASPIEQSTIAQPVKSLTTAPLVEKFVKEGTLQLEKPLDPRTHKVASSQEVGLLAMGDGEGVELPLRAVHVRAKMLDLVGEVVLLQHFVNDNGHAIEARYVFPLDESSAVCGFEAFINGKHVVGIVKEKETARKEYREAIVAGHGAYLMEEEKPDVFTVNVGNLPPHAEVLIKITYIMELRMEGADIIFTLPSALAPSAQLEASRARQLQDVTDTVVSSLKRGVIDVQIALEMPYPVVRMQSLNHAIRTKQAGTRATIEMQTDSLEEDFVLLCALESPFQPRMWVEEDASDENASRACMLSFNPQFETSASGPIEMLFVLDLSNSMGNAEALTDAKLMMRTILSSLRSMTCEFNVVGFGSTHELLFPAPVPSTKANLQTALRYVEGSSSNYGGTELWRPLTKIFRLHSLLADEFQGAGKQARLQNLVVVSDGQFLNQEALMQLARQNSQHSRVFAFGVGNNPSRHALRSLASQGAGQAEFMASPYLAHKSKNEAKLLRQLTRMKQPALRNVSIDWVQDNFKEPASSFQAPSVIHSVFSGERLIVYGFIGNCHSARLSAQLCGGNDSSNNSNFDSTGYFHTRVDAGLSTITKGHIVHRLCARAMVRDYEDGIYSDDRKYHEVIKRNKKSKILELGLTYSLVTQFTSFIAIEKRGEEQDEDFAEPPPTIPMIIEGESVDYLPYMGWKDVPAEAQVSEQWDSFVDEVEEEAEEEPVEQHEEESEYEDVWEEDAEDECMGFSLFDDEGGGGGGGGGGSWVRVKKSKAGAAKKEVESDAPLEDVEYGFNLCEHDENAIEESASSASYAMPLGSASQSYRSRSSVSGKKISARISPTNAVAASTASITRTSSNAVDSKPEKRQGRAGLESFAFALSDKAESVERAKRVEDRPVIQANAKNDTLGVIEAAASIIEEKKLVTTTSGNKPVDLPPKITPQVKPAAAAKLASPAKPSLASPMPAPSHAAAVAPAAKAAAPAKVKEVVSEEDDFFDMGFGLFGDDDDYAAPIRSLPVAPVVHAAAAARAPVPSSYAKTALQEEEEEEEVGFGDLFGGLSAFDDDGGPTFTGRFLDTRSDEGSASHQNNNNNNNNVKSKAELKHPLKKSLQKAIESRPRPVVPQRELSHDEKYPVVEREPNQEPRSRPPKASSSGSDQEEESQKKRVAFKAKVVSSSKPPSKEEDAPLTVTDYDIKEHIARTLAKRIHVISQLEKSKSHEKETDEYGHVIPVQSIVLPVPYAPYDPTLFQPVSYSIPATNAAVEGESLYDEREEGGEKRGERGPIRRRKKKKGGGRSRRTGGQRVSKRMARREVELMRRVGPRVWTQRPQVLRISASEVLMNVNSKRDDGAVDPEQMGWLEGALNLSLGTVCEMLLTLGVRSLGPSVYQACMEALLTALLLAHLLLHWGTDAESSSEIRIAIAKAEQFLADHEEEYGWVWESLDKTALLGVGMKKGDSDNWLSLARAYLDKCRKAVDAEYDEIHKRELEEALWDASGQSLANSETIPAFVAAAKRAAAHHMMNEIEHADESDSDDDSEEEEEEGSGSDDRAETENPNIDSDLEGSSFAGQDENEEDV